jgi:hypothetical protein
MHLLRKPGRVSYPGRHVALVCRSEVTAPPGRNHCRQQHLTGWTAEAWTADGSTTTRTFGHEGTDPGEWWSAVQYILKRGGLVWVWSVDAGRTLALLDTWEMVEDGRLHLAGSDPCDRGEHPLGGGVHNAGVCVLEDPPTIVQLRMPGLPGTLQFVDVRNYGLSGWDALTAGEPSPDALAAWVRTMISELHDRGWGSLKATAGAQAWNIWRHAYMPRAVHVHNDRRALMLERDSYFGGRCEAYRIGAVTGPVYSLDIRSCYPWCARENDLPAELIGYGDGVYPPGPTGPGTRVGLIADVTVRTDTPLYPCRVTAGFGDGPRPVPCWTRRYEDRLHSETIWPVGTFRTCLPGPELSLALERGDVVEWHRWALYELSPVWREIMTDLLNARDRASGHPIKAVCQWYKSLANGLIGKAGQAASAWVDDPSGFHDFAWGTWVAPGPDGKPVRWRSLGGHTQREEWAPDSPDSIPALAAWVTSLARVRLAGLMECAGREHVVYCDTDSLFVDQAGLDSLRDLQCIGHGQPGMLRELGVADGMTVYGHKHYVWGEKTVCAGRPVELHAGAAAGNRYWTAEGIKGGVAARRRPSTLEVARPFAGGGRYKGGEVSDDGSVRPWQL